jgi:hypothetical protein
VSKRAKRPANKAARQGGTRKRAAKKK